MRIKKGTVCATCGFEIDPARHIYSKHTGLYYCVDLDNCHRRAKNDLNYGEISQLTSRIIKGNT